MLYSGLGIRLSPCGFLADAGGRVGIAQATFSDQGQD